MKRFVLQGIELPVPMNTAFEYIADPANLPVWTNAFAEIDGSQATLRTPEGEVDITLRVESSPTTGTVDWYMTFPDGSVGTAFSRVVPLEGERCSYSFVLTPPPVPLEEIEGALDAQAEILAEELDRLVEILGGR